MGNLWPNAKKQLEDTLLGFRIQPWRKVKNRRLIETEKFYLFDVGVSNYLARRTPRIGTPEFGHSFEQYILMELKPLSVPGELNCSYPPAIVGSLHLQISFIQLLST